MGSNLRLLAAAILLGAAGLVVLHPWRPEPRTLILAAAPPQDAQPAAPSSPADSTAPAAPASAAPVAAAVTVPIADQKPAADQKVVPDTRQAVQLSFAPIVKRVAPAVVNVYATSRVQVRSPYAGDPFFERFFGGGNFGAPQERARSSLGSGVILDAQGLVVTNNHVVKDATEVKVALADGREYQAEMLLRDERIDLAVLKLKGGSGKFPVLSLADSDDLEVGDLVLAVGDPFGVGQTVTSGIVSALARTNIGAEDSGFFVQTDAAINPGNSGGALVNVNGGLVGINTAIFSQSGGSVGIGFAIPSNMVRAFLTQARSGSTSVARPWIGAYTQEVTSEIASSLGLAAARGALVTEIDAGSPADKAGMKAGDVILSVGGRDVDNPAALDYRLTVAGTGSPVELKVWRDGKNLPLSVSPKTEPELTDADLTVLGGRGPLSGAVVANLSTSLIDRLHLRSARRGAVIVDLKPSSPAESVGFQAGDVVLRVQGKDIESAADLSSLAKSPASMWRITLNRGGQVSDFVVGG